MNQTEKALLRQLAQQYSELEHRELNAKRIRRLTAVNDLTAGLRPCVWMQEIPWHEMNVGNELTLLCQDDLARNAEWFFRTSLYRIRHFAEDTVLTGYYPLAKEFTSSGIGIDAQEDILRTDSANHIVSHEYHDVLSTEKELAAVKLPKLTAFPERDAQKKEQLEDAFGDILPVKLTGHQVYSPPWDIIPRYRGVEPILMDLYDRPEFIHKTIQKFNDIELSKMEQMEALGLLENDLPVLHCTPGFTNDLPKVEPDGKIRLKNVWYRRMAQMFGTVSPAMHREFELDYAKPLMARCGLVYYGCCEPLDNVIESLKAVPNMRKIGVSPWADVEKCAEMIGGSYVAARKPNPAAVSGTLDEDAVRREIVQTVKACTKYGCPYEFVLKDISTVGRRPQNLTRWSQLVREVLDSYYGPEA
jgi:hypothetical protein